MLTKLDAEINLNDTDEINTDLDKLKYEINQRNEGKAFDNVEQTEKYVEPQVIIDAIFTHFKKEIKLFKYLSSGIKKEISSVLKNYLSKHHLLVIGKDGKMRLVVDDESKKDFVITLKDIITTMKNEVNNDKLLRSSLRLCGKYKEVINSLDKLDEYFDNLDTNLYNMPKMKYMKIMFRHVGGIVKEVLLKQKSGSMTYGEFFEYIFKCYKNKHEEWISDIMSNTHKKGDTTPIKFVSVTDATWIGSDD